jgi:hypothetical protein
MSSSIKSLFISLYILRMLGGVNLSSWLIVPISLVTFYTSN